MTVNTIYFCCFLIFSGFLRGQNFRYNPEDWYILTRPGAINAITEDNFNLYFATDNGVYRYDKAIEDFKYDYSFSAQLEFPQIRHMVYDTYRDYFWVVHNNGISYKSSVSSFWQEMSLASSRIFNYYEIDDIGISPEFIWVRSMNDRLPFDPFSSMPVDWKDARKDADFIEWGHSQFGIAGNNMEISHYTIDDDWTIGLNDITHKDGQSMHLTMYMEDDDGNQWFGTTKGYVLKGWRHSSRLELITIGLPFDHVTIAYQDTEGSWWFADSHFKRTGRTGRMSIFDGIYQRGSKPFIVQWLEMDNQWVYYTPEESIIIEHTDVNAILQVGSTVYFGTMFGILYLDLYNREWNLIDATKGLNDTAVWDMIEYDGSIFVGTARGINEISIVNHSPIPDWDNRYETLSRLSIYDMEADSEFIYLATDSGLLKMDWENGNLTMLSKKEFYKISLEANSIAGTDGSLWLLEDGMEEKYIASKVHDFDICGSYIWISHGDKVVLLDTVTSREWEYGQEDGIPGKNIYGINCDVDWAWFLTNKGVAFYNWERYHYDKN